MSKLRQAGNVCNIVGRPPKHPFARMDIGSSVWYSGETSLKMQRYSHSLGMRSNPAKKFVTRAEGGGVRIWRIS